MKKLVEELSGLEKTKSALARYEEIYVDQTQQEPKKVKKAIMLRTERMVKSASREYAELESESTLISKSASWSKSNPTKLKTN